MAAGVERIGARLWRTAGRGGRPYVLRPLTPADVPAMQGAWAAVSPQDRMMRALHALPVLPERLARALCTVDPARDVALVFTPAGEPDRLVGGARLMRDRDGDAAEYAVTIVRACQRQGLGRKALETAIGVGREIGTRAVWGLVDRRNAGMRRLAARLGMTEAADPDDDALLITRLRL